jgi:hypothetical protein
VKPGHFGWYDRGQDYPVGKEVSGEVGLIWLNISESVSYREYTMLRVYTYIGKRKSITFHFSLSLLKVKSDKVIFSLFKSESEKSLFSLFSFFEYLLLNKNLILYSFI